MCAKEVDQFLTILGQDSEQLANYLNGSLSLQDWHAILQLSNSHGVASLVYKKLYASGCASLVPPVILSQLQSCYLKSVSESIKIKRDIAFCLDILMTHDIRCIPLKGTFVGQKVYGDLAFRPMGDIDILIPHADLSTAYESFIDHGYQPQWPLLDSIENLVEHHLPPMRKPGRTPVEIHWKLLDQALPFTIDIEEIWQEARPGHLFNRDVMFMRYEAYILHTCVHGAYQDNFSGGMKFISDVTEMLVGQNAKSCIIDWQYFMDLTAKWHIIRCVFLTLQISRNLLDAPVPQDVLDSLQPQAYKPEIYSRSIEQLFQKKEFSPNLAEFWSVPAWNQKFRLAKNRIFLPRHRLVRDYPSLAASRFYRIVYPLHLFKVICRQVLGFWRLLVKESESLEAVRIKEGAREIQEWMAVG